MRADAALLLVLAAGSAHAAAVSKKAMTAMLATIDDRQRNSGDYASLIYMEQKQRDKVDTVFEAVVYRRDADQQLMILFTKPKAEAGKGYLRIDKNLWIYDPNVGKWERRTERERIGGTNSRRADFDQSRLAEEYDPADGGPAKLGPYTARLLELKSKPGMDVEFPTVKLWVDEASGNTLKRQDFALSGRLMRTDYYPKWEKLRSESKGADVWFPKEMHFFDEIDTANSTLIVIKSVDLRALEANMFTKAWLESKSR